MSPSDADPSPEAVPPDVSLAQGESPGASLAGGPTTRRRAPPVRIWALTLTAGLIAGLASWLVGETFHGRLQPALLATAGIPTAAEANADAVGRVAAVTLEATLAFGSLGAALGLALGVAGGSARPSVRAASIAAISGTILGAAAGAAMTQVLLPIYFRFYDPDADDLALAMAIQGGICSVIGAAGGVAFGLGLGGRNQALRPLLGGLLGAIAGVLVYELVGALAFPLDETTKPISATSGTRLIARLAVAILASAGATMGVGPAPRDESRPA